MQRKQEKCVKTLADNNNNNNNNNKLQMGCHSVAVVIMHVHKYEIKMT